MKSDFVEQAVFERIFPYMTPDNRRAISLSLQTGIRIGDIVKLRRKDLNRKTGVLKFTASKTGKSGEVRLSWEVVEQLIKNSGKTYLFEGKSVNKHRTRQAVWADVKRATERAGITGVNITPHSARKTFAVNDFRRLGNLEEVREHLQHANLALTEYYARSNEQKKDGFSEEEFLEKIRFIVHDELREFLPLIISRLQSLQTDEERL